jgi:hypothetical protein
MGREGLEAAQWASTGSEITWVWAAAWDSPENTLDAQADLLRDLFGNPFRPVTLDPAWLTPTVTGMAQAAYQERDLPSGHLDPARLAVLADALEEVGADRALLDHLRSTGPHIRGCFVVDVLLGKE